MAVAQTWFLALSRNPLLTTQPINRANRATVLTDQPCRFAIAQADQRLLRTVSAELLMTARLPVVPTHKELRVAGGCTYVAERAMKELQADFRSAAVQSVFVKIAFSRSNL